MHQQQGLTRRASRHRLGVIVLALLASVFMYATPAQATPAADNGAANDVGVQSRAVIQNYQNKQCLWHNSATNYNLYAVDDNDCGLWGTGWTLTLNSSNYYTLKNAETGKCAYVNASTNNAPVKMYTCGGYLDQQWGLRLFHYNGKILQSFVNRYTGKCLVKRATELNVVQHDCGSYPDQGWSTINL